MMRRENTESDWMAAIRHFFYVRFACSSRWLVECANQTFRCSAAKFAEQMSACARNLCVKHSRPPGLDWLDVSFNPVMLIISTQRKLKNQRVFLVFSTMLIIFAVLLALEWTHRLIFSELPSRCIESILLQTIYYHKTYRRQFQIAIGH